MSILFDVVLFLREKGKQLKLTHIQKVILFTLAGRIGKNKDCWIKQSELAKECELSLRGFILNLKVILDHKLIKIEKVITKKGKQNRYRFADNWMTYMHEDAHSVKETTCTAVHEDPPPTCTTVHIPTCTTVHVPPSEKTLEAPATIAFPAIQVPVKETIEIDNKAKRQSLVRFDEFWALYPRKISLKVARKKWSTLKCDKVADEIINDVKARNATDWAALEKQFIPHPATYLNQERWKDEPEGLANAKVSNAGKLTYRQQTTQRNWDRLKNWN